MQGPALTKSTQPPHGPTPTLLAQDRCSPGAGALADPWRRSAPGLARPLPCL